MRQIVSAVLICLTLAGCGPGWHRTDPAPGTALAPTDQFLVHHGGRTDRLHALQVTDDSVAGIPWLKPIDCDSCRIALPRASVDSIRLGHPTAGLWKGYALAALGPFVALSLICIVSGESAGCWVPPST